MKIQMLTFILFAIPFVLNAQTYRLTLGEEMKLKKGTSDLDIVAADNSGIYIAENRVKGAFSFTNAFNIETRLIKFDNNYQEVYGKDYNKELDDHAFHSFHTIGNDLFLVATGYIKKEKTVKVFAAKIDKSSGNFTSPLQELGNYNLDDKKDFYQLQAAAIENNSRLMLVSEVSAAGRTRIAIDVLDGNLAKKHSVVINLAYSPGHYKLQDVKLTAGNHVVLLGKEMQEVQDGKKKTKLVFKQFRITIYDANGAKFKDVAVDAGNRFIVNGKLFGQSNAEMLLAGFYSNDASKSKINGFFTSRINTDKGELTSTVFKEIAKPVIGSFDTSAKEAPSEQFGNQYNIRTVNENSTNGSYIITAEASDYTTWTRSEMERQATGTVTKWYTWHRFSSNDLLIISAEKSGDIRWLTILPKSQIEEFRSTGSNVPFYSAYSDYFAQGGGMPYYSSYKTMLHQNKLLLFFNDHSENRDAQPGNNVKPISDFKDRSNLYAVSVDMATGKMARKMVTANSDELILMPRHGYVTNNEVLIPSLKGRILAKTILKIAKLSVK